MEDEIDTKIARTEYAILFLLFISIVGFLVFITWLAN